MTGDASRPVSPDSSPPPAAAQPRNPLHGLTLEAILSALVAHYGWAGLAERIALRCFTSQPSIASSLKVLRKTPWARDKVESLYLFMLREQRRHAVPATTPSPTSSSTPSPTSSPTAALPPSGPANAG